MFKDAAHRSIDLTTVLDLPATMLDVRVLFTRCGVNYQDHWYTPPGTLHEKGTNYLILVPDPQDAKGTGNLGAVWAHVVQVRFSMRESLRSGIGIILPHTYPMTMPKYAETMVMKP